VLISGRGSNLKAILDAIEQRALRAEIGVVISNRPAAAGLEYARTAGIPAVAIDSKSYGSREGFDEALVGVLSQHRVDLVCLAGFMRLVTPVLLDAFPQRVLNVHPSLLPAFPGLEAQSQAWTYGVKVSGATVHLVTPGLDEGPIVAQEAVDLDGCDSAADVAVRILRVEHRLYPAAIQRILDGGWRVDGRRVRFVP
jgi:phosphoribosylglycinamide formyltransferase-1